MTEEPLADFFCACPVSLVVAAGGDSAVPEAGSFELPSSLPQAAIVIEGVRQRTAVTSVRFIDAPLFLGEVPKLGMKPCERISGAPLRLRQ